MKKSGFTLVELIFVIVIIGLLAAVAVPKFLATKKRAETANFPEIGNQIVTKANEQYSLIGIHDLQKIINDSNGLKTYVDELDQNKTPFRKTALSSDHFKIVYAPDGNTSSTKVCLEINVSHDDVNISASRQIKAYNFKIVELNTSCNQD